MQWTRMDGNGPVYSGMAKRTQKPVSREFLARMIKAKACIARLKPLYEELQALDARVDREFQVVELKENGAWVGMGYEEMDKTIAVIKEQHRAARGKK